MNVEKNKYKLCINNNTMIKLKEKEIIATVKNSFD